MISSAYNYRHLWDKIRVRARADIQQPQSQIRGCLAKAMTVLAQELLSRPSAQKKLNAWSLRVAASLTERHRHQVSALITAVVESWDAEEVANKLELEIGPDLQHIRINGTLVGGTAGLALHMAIYLVPTL